MKNNKIKQLIGDWLQIIVGSCIVAFGFVAFISPYKLVPGGVFGLSIVLHELWPQFQVGTFGYFLQFPLVLLTLLLVGKSLGVRTIITMLITPFVMNTVSLLAYPDASSLQNLDPSQLLGGSIDLSNHLLLAAIFGGALVGAGSGLIIRTQTGTGGTDLVGMIINKYTGFKFTHIILCVDATIILIGLLVTGSVIHSLYSLIAILSLNKSISFVLNGQRDAKIIYIISEGSQEEIRQYILYTLDITATKILSKGLYSESRKDLLMLVVHDKMVPRIVKGITQFAPDAFLVVADAYETYGERWRSFPDKDELIL